MSLPSFNGTVRSYSVSDYDKKHIWEFVRFLLECRHEMSRKMEMTQDGVCEVPKKYAKKVKAFQ